MFRMPPVAAMPAIGGIVWTTMVHNGRTDDLAMVVWHADTFDPRRDPAYLESLYLQLERRLAMKIGEPVPNNDPEELLAALGRESRQYQAPAAGPVKPAANEPPKRWTTPETIDREFGYHKPTEKTLPVHDLVRELLRQLAHELNDLLPECPRKTEAIGHLRTAMWASNSAVAAYGGSSPAWVPAVKPIPPSPYYPGIPEVGDPDGEAKLAYHAYGAVTDWLNYRGDPMPTWENLGDKIQSAWRVAAATAFVRGRDSVRADFQKPSRPSDQEAAEAVFQAIGTASVCWEDLTGAGVFNDRLAAQVGNDLLVKLGFTVPENYRAQPVLDAAHQEAQVGPADPLDLLRTDQPEAGERESSEPE